MENFNLKKFLVENKLTTNSRVINEATTLQDFYNSDEYEAIRGELEDIAANESGISFEDAFKEALEHLRQNQPDLNLSLIIKYKDDIFGL